MNEMQLDKLIQLYEMLEELLVDVAEDQATPAKTLVKLAALTEGGIVEAVHMHPNTPSRIIEKRLAISFGVGGFEEESRIHMVGNPALRLQIVRQLATKDPAPEVRDMSGMVLAQRVTIQSNTTASQLWKIFNLVLENARLVGNNHRFDIAKDALFAHPNFPHEKLQEKEKKGKKTPRKI